MSDQQVTVVQIEPRKYTVSYSRKVNLGNYSSEDFGVFVPVTVDDGATDEEIEREVKGAAAFAKSLVFDQLGILYGIDTDAGVVRAVEQEAPEASKSSAKPAAKRAPAKKAASKAEASWDDLAENPGDYYDNRETKKGNQPDFRHAESKDGLWIDGKFNKPPEDFDFDALEGLCQT